jgi:DNA processing protein
MNHRKEIGNKKIEEEWLSQPQHFLITPSDASYPPLLKEIPDPPRQLYVMGNLELLSAPQVAVVGSRLPTPIGREIAMEIAGGLASVGITVTSGLARGIDGAAHTAALLAPASTVAVLGHGLLSIYPARHQRLAQEIIGYQGALVSEFPLSSPPRSAHFPQRNRIISGLSLGTVVIEAARRSGSLITARLAAEQNRQVFAVPGSIRNPLAAGCHDLIRQGATLIHSVEDIISELKEALRHALGPLAQPSVRNSSWKHQLDAKAEKLLECIGFEGVVIDQLMTRSGYSIAEVSSLLFDLELKGYIKVELGGVTRIS